MSPPPDTGGESRIPLKESDSGGYVASVEVQITQLMSATKRGDPAAFDELTRSIRGRAFAVARSLVGSRDDAMDLTQEALLKTYRARDTYRDGEPFLPWFHRILRNTCFSFLRKRNRLRQQALTRRDADGEEADWEIADEQTSPSEGLERDEASTAFWEGFRRLSARDREILTLRPFQELSYKGIAHALDIPEGTVMSRLFHARRRLRDLLTPHLEDSLKDYAQAAPTGSDATASEGTGGKP